MDTYSNEEKVSKEFLETEEGKDIRSKVEEHIQFNTGDKCPNMKLSEILEIKYDITEEPDTIIISESFANIAISYSFFPSTASGTVILGATVVDDAVGIISPVPLKWFI